MYKDFDDILEEAWSEEEHEEAGAHRVHPQVCHYNVRRYCKTRRTEEHRNVHMSSLVRIAGPLQVLQKAWNQQRQGKGLALPN